MHFRTAGASPAQAYVQPCGQTRQRVWLGCWGLGLMSSTSILFHMSFSCGSFSKRSLHTTFQNARVQRCREPDTLFLAAKPSSPRRIPASLLDCPAEVENCRVPISTGRLLVFSNYQAWGSFFFSFGFVLLLSLAVFFGWWLGQLGSAGLGRVYPDQTNKEPDMCQAKMDT